MDKYEIISMVSFVIGLIVIALILVTRIDWGVFRQWSVYEYEARKTINQMVAEEQQLNEWKKQQDMAKTFK